MAHTLVLGRDLNDTGTDVGPEVTTLLAAALAHQRHTGATLVVAAGFSPDFPAQPQSYAAMMRDWLVAHGATDIVVLEASHFSTYGELKAFHSFCTSAHVRAAEVLGFDWHVARALVEARQAGGRVWAKQLYPVPVPGRMKLFDQFLEPLKWAKLLLPRRWQVRAITFWKEYVSQRTSY